LDDKENAVATPRAIRRGYCKDMEGDNLDCKAEMVSDRF
jgi:hypothetical protein